MRIGDQRPNEDLSFGMQVPKEVQLELLERPVQIGGQNLVDLTYRLGLFVGEGFVTNWACFEVFGSTCRISGSSAIVVPQDKSRSVVVTATPNAERPLSVRSVLRTSRMASATSVIYLLSSKETHTCRQLVTFAQFDPSDTSLSEHLGLSSSVLFQLGPASFRLSAAHSFDRRRSDRPSVDFLLIVFLRDTTPHIQALLIRISGHSIMNSPTFHHEMRCACLLSAEHRLSASSCRRQSTFSETAAKICRNSPKSTGLTKW
jgi:hypothetical protein